MYGKELPHSGSRFLVHLPTSNIHCIQHPSVGASDTWCGQAIFPVWIDGVIDRAKGTRT